MIKGDYIYSPDSRCFGSAFGLSVILAAGINTVPYLNTREHNTNIKRKDDLSFGQLYHKHAPTWSDVTTEEALPETGMSDVSASLAVIKQLAFIEGDYIAEKKADDFFDNAVFSTKKVIIRKSLQRQNTVGLMDQG